MYINEIFVPLQHTLMSFSLSNLLKNNSLKVPREYLQTCAAFVPSCFFESLLQWGLERALLQGQLVLLEPVFLLLGWKVLGYNMGLLNLVLKWGPRRSLQRAFKGHICLWSPNHKFVTVDGGSREGRSSASFCTNYSTA